MISDIFIRISLINELIQLYAAHGISLYVGVMLLPRQPWEPTYRDRKIYLTHTTANNKAVSILLVYH